MSEIDEEFANYIEETIAESNGNYIDALDKVIEWEKNNRGLVGFHVGTPLDVLCGLREVEDAVEEANKVAHDTLLMLLESAKGELKEVTHDELDVL